MHSELDRPLIEPEKVRSNSYPTAEQIHALGAEMVQSNVPEDIRLLFAKLAVLTPDDRLAKNIKALTDCMALKPVYNLFSDGLKPEEHAALVDLDMRGLSIQSRETAHGLLNVHERWYMIRPMRRLFRQANESDGGYIVPTDE